MVLMTMRDNKSFYFLNIVFQVCHIWNNKVNSKHTVLRECQSAIHNNNTVFVLESSNVHSDLLESPEWNDTHTSNILFFQVYTST